jgi:ribonuclease-3
MMKSLEARIQHQFRQPALLQEALTHASIRYESKKDVRDNQRLEFLGDSVLELILTEKMYHLFPDADEGLLTKLRTRLVSTGALAKQAKLLGLGQHLLMGRGEENVAGRERESTLADALESVLGAIYLDGGLETARAFVHRIMEDELIAIAAQPTEVNPKGELQEILQGATSEAPTYEIISSGGPDHKRQFEAVVRWRGLTLGRGLGVRKKEAEIAAARDALLSPTLQASVKSQAPGFSFTVSHPPLEPLP